VGVLYYAFSVFLAPMEAELGWSRGATTGAFSIALVVSGFAGVPVGRWLDHRGGRLLMSVGSVVGTLLVLAWAGSDSLLLFYFIWAAIGLVMATVLYEPAFAVVAVWFDRNRARALTALTLIAGFSSTVFLPLAAWLVQVQGWRQALVSLAVILAIGTLPVARTLAAPPVGRYRPPRGRCTVGGASWGTADSRRHTARGGTASPRLSLARSRLLPSTAIASGVHIHLVPILLDLGYAPTLGAALSGLVGAMQVLGRIVMVPLAGRLSLRTLSAAVLALQPLALLVLLLVSGFVGVFAFVARFGAAKGCMTLVRPAFVAELCGATHYASIAGVLALAATLTQAVAPVGAGATYDAQGSYVPILCALVVVSALASLALLPIRGDSSTSSGRRTGAEAANC
jgi:MFS family permease